MHRPAQLGLGTIGIGRAWGYANAIVPSEEESRSVLESAVEAGYKFFDTAPSYGWSDQRLGSFLDAKGAGGLTIATKFGEGWNFERGETFIDHSYDGLCRSLDRSMELLGRIDVLQLHKTNPDVLRSPDLRRAWDYAESLGIRQIGPSVSDLESAELAVAEPRYSVIQAPYNRADHRFEAVLRRAADRGMLVITNRPFAMGEMLHGDVPTTEEDALAFVLNQQFGGVILTGSKNSEHIRRNAAAFRSVLKAL
jgi:aryl-alcohol dehydrogenase-like predicted oxidoreductase